MDTLRIERVGKVEIDPTVNPSVRINARWWAKRGLDEAKMREGVYRASAGF
jgi:hypothetical protein